MKTLRERLEPVINGLRRPPYEWNNVRVRQILIDCDNFNEETTGISFRLGKKMESGSLSENELDEGLCTLYHTVKSRTIDLIGKICALSETEKRQLVVSCEDDYPDFVKSGHFDEVCIRDEIFDYILSPSDEVIALHKKHELRMKLELDKSDEEDEE
jgi:hypothetical protein